MTPQITGTHPYADRFPMLPADELDELAASIAANGLRNPVVVTPDGLILDGRNRAAACVRLGVEPETVVYEGADLAEYVIDCNTTRRHLSTGQRAMASALVLADDGRRENGRWQYGLLRDSQDLGNSAGREALRQAGIILDYAPELAASVIDGASTLNAAFATADERRRSAEADKLAERARLKREADEARAKAELDAHLTEQLADTKYAAMIADGALTPAAAWAAHQADTELERKRQREIEHGWRTTCLGVAERASFFRGGGAYARTFLADAYPHESDYVPEGLRLTRATALAASDFFTTLAEGLPQ